MNIETPFQVDGSHLVPRIFENIEIDSLLATLPELDGAAGNRELLSDPHILELALSQNLIVLAKAILGDQVRPRRAILFDKNPEVNWVLGYHQDLKIAVKQKVDVDGYSAWSIKSGVTHCQPPEEVLRRCLAIRIHLDDCPATNGPIRIKVGSHKFGIQPEPPANCPERTCTAKRGDVLLMHPLVWHASSKSEISSHRRVLHIEYSSADLNPRLEWAYGELGNRDF